MRWSVFRDLPRETCPFLDERAGRAEVVKTPVGFDCLTLVGDERWAVWSI